MSKVPKKLQAEWDVKLKQSGFDDIEQDEFRLKKWDSHYFSARYSELTFTSKAEYFIWAERMLIEQQFKGIKEKTVWWMHSQGYLDKEIGEVVGMSGKGIWSMRQRIENGFTIKKD